MNTLSGGFLDGLIVQIAGAARRLYKWPVLMLGQVSSGVFAPIKADSSGNLSFSQVAAASAFTQSAFALNGGSQTIATTISSTKLLRITNPTANNSVWVRFDGGTAVASDGVSVEIQPGGSEVFAALVPLGAITIIGTNAQNVTLITA